MKILSIDTSSKNATVAITENEEAIIEINNLDEKTHSQKLMPMIDEALKKTKTSLEDIKLIVCSLGPGSFTGVRIGIATAKAFVDSKNIAAVGINSLEELAYNLNKEGLIVTLLDAGHGNTYAGIFEIEKDKNDVAQTISENLKFLNLKNENGKLDNKELIEFLDKNLQAKDIKKNKTIYFVGDATTIYKEILQDLKVPYQENETETSFYNIEIANEKQNILSGITLARIGYTKYKNGNYGDTKVLSPIYLRKSQAELQLENSKNKQN